MPAEDPEQPENVDAWEGLEGPGPSGTPPVEDEHVTRHQFFFANLFVLLVVSCCFRFREIVRFAKLILRQPREIGS